MFQFFSAVADTIKYLGTGCNYNLGHASFAHRKLSIKVQFSSTSLPPDKFWLYFSEAVDPLVLDELRKEEINKEKLVSTISNIITYTIYIFLLIALTTTMNGQNTYYQKEQVEKLIDVSVTFY